MKSYFLAVAALFMCASLYSQQFHGEIRDANTKEPIPLASVYISDVQVGARTDSLGVFHFHISLPENVTLKVSAFGYESLVKSVNTKQGAAVIELSENHLEIDEIVVSTPGSNEQRMNVTHVEVHSVEKLNEVATSNMGELLEKIPGVYNASSGNGVSKPVVRGLQGIRVVSMLNGLRLENQQWGGDHGLGVTELGIGNIEVLKGPASLLYGADALGGVIFYSDENYADMNTASFDYSTQVESATLGLTNQMMLKYSKNNHRFNIGVRSSDHADYRLPGGGYLVNSRYYDRALKFAYGVNKGKWAMHARYNYFNSRVGIIGHAGHEEEHEEENEEDHPEDEFIDEHQERSGMIPAQNYSNHYASLENTFITKKGKLSLLIGQTVTALREHEELFSEASMNSVLSNSVYNFRLIRNVSQAMQLVVGAQGMYQQNRNSPSAEEELIPDADQIDNGVYSLLNYTKNKWKLQGGVRYDLRILENKLASESYQFGGVNFSMGAVHASDKALTRINISSGMRTPHLSEMFAEGEHHGALRFEIGNKNLISERGLQLDITQEYSTEHFGLVFNPYFNFIQNYIYLEFQDSIIEELPVYEYKQLSSAMLYGADLGVHYHPHFAHGLHIESTISYLEGIGEDGNNLVMIPQGRLKTQLKYAFDMEGWVAIKDIVLQHTYVMAQRKTAPLERNSVDYHLIDLGLNLTMAKNEMIILSLGVKNILDQKYVDHLSRLKVFDLSGPGRNIYLKLSLGI